MLALVIAASPQHHRHHGYPLWWRRQASCIRYQESRGEWHIQDGAYQIIPSTWLSFRPRGWPARAEQVPPSRQTLVAWRIWIHNGRSWGANSQWPNSAAACGVR